MNDHGYRVAVFNRTVSKVDEFLINEAKGTRLSAPFHPRTGCGAQDARRVMLMVKAGDTVDHMIEALVPTSRKATSLSTAAIPLHRQQPPLQRPRC